MDIYCGLEPRPTAKLAPEEQPKEEPVSMSEQPEQSGSPEGTKPREAPRPPFWERVADASGFLLLLLTALLHALYH